MIQQARLPLPAESHGDHVRQVIDHWARLAGVAPAVRSDPRLGIVDRQLDRLACRPATAAVLCADGSPVEFCERIGASEPAPALTLAGFDAAGRPDFEHLTLLVGPLLGAAGTARLERRVGTLAASLQHLWLGIDFAQPAAMRLYCKPATATAAAIGAALAGGADQLFGCPLTATLRSVLADLLARGRDLVVGFDIAGDRPGIKLALAHPLDRRALERVAAACGLVVDPLAAWLDALRPGRGAWPLRRCGLGLAVDAAGAVTALTAYHYAAPYFRDDEALRVFVLDAAPRFGWRTDTYRHASRLLDGGHDRRRHLLGFTTARGGATSLRTYANTGLAA